jgi:hypothetical protein
MKLRSSILNLSYALCGPHTCCRLVPAAAAAAVPVARSTAKGRSYSLKDGY